MNSRAFLVDEAPRFQSWRILAFFPIAACLLALILFRLDTGVGSIIGRVVAAFGLFHCGRVLVRGNLGKSNTGFDYTQHAWVTGATYAAGALLFCAITSTKRLGEAGASEAILELVFAVTIQTMVIWVTYFSKLRYKPPIE